MKAVWGEEEEEEEEKDEEEVEVAFCEDVAPQNPDLPDFFRTSADDGFPAENHDDDEEPRNSTLLLLCDFYFLFVCDLLMNLN